ncbi:MULTISPECIES: YlaH-like family protein [Bacillus]|uniref:YlaH-like family protein n=1 Tax=Bacillus TaxID=1386 RepID=UPI0002E3D170|nr:MULTISPECIES: YlaH-like family protein [Bacillus]
MGVDVSERLSFFASLFEVDKNPESGMLYLYFVVFVLSAVVYKLGFAKKLSLLKNIVIYVCLALGCTILTFFAAFLPMAEGLCITALFLAIYRFRLHLHRKAEKTTS